MMTKNEVRAAIKNAVVDTFLAAFPTAIQIKDFTFAVPVGDIGEDGVKKYAKFDLTAAQWYDTATVEAFDPETAVEAYEEEKREKAEKAAEAEAKKKEAAAKKSKPRKKKNEDEE